MKKALLLLSVIIAAIILIDVFKQDISPSSDLSSAPETVIQPTGNTDRKEPLFILKAYEGKIAVFKDGQSKPYRVLEDVVFKTLPKYDRELLEEGIKVYSLDELHSLIEDYDS